MRAPSGLTDESVSTAFDALDSLASSLRSADNDGGVGRSIIGALDNLIGPSDAGDTAAIVGNASDSGRRLSTERSWWESYLLGLELSEEEISIMWEGAERESAMMDEAHERRRLSEAANDSVPLAISVLRSVAQVSLFLVPCGYF